MTSDSEGCAPAGLVVMGATPTLGRLELGISMAERLAVEQGKAVAFYSLSLSGEELALHFLASIAHIPIATLKGGDLEDADFDRLEAAQRVLRSAPLWIDDNCPADTTGLRSSILDLVRTTNLSGVIVDHLELLFAADVEPDEVRRELAQIGTDLQLPIVVLSSSPPCLAGRA